MYTYESAEQGDLTFQQGDVILVTKKDGDWWTGTVGDKSGVFPSNYVRLKDAEVNPVNRFLPLCAAFSPQGGSELGQWNTGWVWLSSAMWQLRQCDLSF